MRGIPASLEAGGDAVTNLATYYDNAEQIIPLTAEFTNIFGAFTNPDTVVFILTDPNGTTTTYTGTGTDPNNIVNDAPGEYHIWLMPFSAMPKPPAGLWTYVWTGIGGSVAEGAQIYTGSFRVMPLTDVGTGFNQWYCSKEELKSRLQIDASDTGDDHEIQLVMQAVTDWITSYCGRHFYRVSETRTFVPGNVWTLDIDDIVTCTSLDLDYDGDGVYEVHWTENVNFQLLQYPKGYNAHNLGVPKPRNFLQVTSGTTGNPATGSGWLPWLIPFTPQNRVSITGVWGWETIPPNVTQAALYIAAEMFKAKDSPFGVAGIGELGIVKIAASPWVVELLRPYKSARAVGI